MFAFEGAMKRSSVIAVCMLAILIPALPGCRTSTKTESKNVHQRNINDVLKDNTKQIMSLPGVVGLYVGQQDDGKPCIKVMVKEKTKHLEQSIPSSLEGYPVLIDVTGEIRPF